MIEPSLWFQRSIIWYSSWTRTVTRSRSRILLRQNIRVNFSRCKSRVIEAEVLRGTGSKVTHTHVAQKCLVDVMRSRMKILGSLNPLSGHSIYESCILPILLYGCATWLLDTTSLKALEDFQCEIGKRILCLPKFHSKNVMRIALHWPSMTPRILIRKLTFLAKFLSNTKDIITSVVAFSHHWQLWMSIMSASFSSAECWNQSLALIHYIASCLENPP